MKNNCGHTLIQLLLSTALTLALGLGVAYLVSSQQKEVKSLLEKVALIDFQKAVSIALLDGRVCEYILNNPSQRTFNASAVDSGQVQKISVPQIYTFADASSPKVAEAGKLASAHSSSLFVESIDLVIEEGREGTYKAHWEIHFDPIKANHEVKPVTMSTLLKVDKTQPTAAKIISCNGKNASTAGCPNNQVAVGLNSGGGINCQQPAAVICPHLVGTTIPSIMYNGYCMLGDAAGN